MGSVEPGTPTFYVYILVIIGLVLFAGMMSGLTLGLMSLGLVDLEVLLKSGQPADRKHAGNYRSLSLSHSLSEYLCFTCAGLPLFGFLFVGAVTKVRVFSPWHVFPFCASEFLFFGGVIGRYCDKILPASL
jgi:hypothetical protein